MEGGQVRGGNRAGGGPRQGRRHTVDRRRVARGRTPASRRWPASSPPSGRSGTVTAGNAPGLNDGASALVVASLAFAKAHGLAPLARITGYATGGRGAEGLFFAPILAVQNLMATERRQDRRLRSDRGQRGVRGPGDRRRPGARVGLEPGQRQRRRGGAGPPDRRERRPGADDPALRACGTAAAHRSRDALPRRRQRGGPQRGE